MPEAAVGSWWRPGGGRSGKQQGRRKRQQVSIRATAAPPPPPPVDYADTGAGSGASDVASLKIKLLSAVSGLNRGLAASQEDLDRAEAAAGGPVDHNRDLDRLQGRWRLLYRRTPIPAPLLVCREHEDAAVHVITAQVLHAGAAATSSSPS